MRQEPEAFGDRDLKLVHIARKLDDALRLEEILTAAGVDYAVEADQYTVGFLFRRQRAGAFFYVTGEDEPRARGVLRDAGFVPFDPAP